MTPTAIVVTGASAGIGEALAVRYAGPEVALCLVARRAAALDGVSARCRAAGASVDIVELDVRDAAALAARLAAFDARHPVDLVIANAGVALGERSEAEVRTVLDINLGGALNTVLPLVAGMQARGRGQIAFMSSLAAFSPLPDAPAYSASKAALLAYGRALRQKLRRDGVRVSVVCPGFVRTGMGERYKGWRPLEMSAEAAASRIVAGLARDRAVIGFPSLLVAAARLSGALPDPVLRLAMRVFRFSVEAPARRT